MDESEYNRLFKKAYNYAKRRNFGEESNDFAQEYAIKCYTSGVEKNVKFAFIDYSDFLRASKRLLSSPDGYLSKNVRISLDATVGRENQDSATISDFIGVSGNQLDDLGYDSQNKSVLTGKESMIYELYFNEGFNLKEVGEYFNFTESRVSQILSNINRKIKKLYEDGEILNLFLSKIKSKDARLLSIKVFKKGIK